MCDGKNSSKRDVVILSIKPKRPDYPSHKLVPVSELQQEWDKLDAYYRGQILKLKKSLSKYKSQKKRSRISVNAYSPSSVSSKHSSYKSSPVNKKHSSSLSSDQFQELFGDENLFASDDGHKTNRHNNKSNKLLHSKSLNSLFEDSLDGIIPAPAGNNGNSRKTSLANSNTHNLVVSIPLNDFGDNYINCDDKKRIKYERDDDNETYFSDGEDTETEEEVKNFLSVPRDNFQVQYGTKQKTRVALVEAGGVSPKWIVPIHVAPYKPPTAQGLNGVQIQKILYHKNDSINYASPTTTTARTPDKPPDNLIGNAIAPPPSKVSAKVSVSSNSPVSTVSPSPRSISSGTATPSPPSDYNNATPKQISAQTPELSSPKSDQGSVKSGSSSSSSGKFSFPSVNPTSGSKLKRPISTDSHTYGHAKKQKLSEEKSPASFKSIPVTSTSSSAYSSSSSSSSSGDLSETDNHGSYSRHSRKDKEKEKSHHKVAKSPAPPEKIVSPKKLNIINKNPTFLKPSTVGENQSGAAVFLPPPPGISITDRIIKKASMPQPELLERQRRRRLESNQRKSYAMQKGDEQEEKESIDLSMKSFEMIWNIPLLSPLRSP